jgi:hypothetical protein
LKVEDGGGDSTIGNLDDKVLPLSDSKLEILIPFRRQGLGRAVHTVMFTDEFFDLLPGEAGLVIYGYR